jgi:hypothetical protein
VLDHGVIVGRILLSPARRRIGSGCGRAGTTRHPPREARHESPRETLNETLQALRSLDIRHDGAMRLAPY